MADTFTLAGIVFDGFAAPDHVPAGGRQAMVVHKLPGGSRVIDTLGPDEDDIQIKGHFFSNDAYDRAITLDALRAAGGVVTFTWGGQYREVLIEHFQYQVIRFPVWIEYQINLVVVTNPSLGQLVSSSTSTIDDLVTQDLDSAALA